MLRVVCSSCAASHLLPCADAAAAQRVDVVAAAVHEATDEAVVAEDDAGHLCDVLLAVVVADVAAVVHQAGHQVALAQLLGSTLFNLAKRGQQTGGQGKLFFAERRAAFLDNDCWNQPL